MKRRVLICLVVMTCLLPWEEASRAQVAGARLVGAVTDETQAVLPGATVSVTTVETGIRRTTTTDPAGRYVFANLSPATYDLEASLPGFKTTMRRGIILTVGSEVATNLTLSVGDVTEQVTVVGEAPLVETRSGAVAGVVEERVIRDLPLNGRSFTDLIQLEPGVVRTRAANKAALSGLGDKMSLGGARPHQMSFLLDGADLMSRNNTNPSGVSGLMMGVESIQEFRVSTSAFSAEFGRNSGGVVSAVTKSGTNEFHGTVYEFLRNDNLDARSFFDRDKPEFERNQFGFSVGGPVFRNKTFFFGNYEGLRQRLGGTFADTVPTLDARRGVLPNATVQVAESVKPYLALYPLPNGPELGGGVARYFWSGSTNTNQDDFVVRLDHQLSESDSLMGRVLFDDGRVTSPLSSPTTTSLGLVQNFNDSRIQSYVLNYKRIFGASAVNDFRITYSRDAMTVADAVQEGMNALAFVPGRGFGVLAPGAVTGIQTNSSGPQFWRQNQFEYIDDAAVARGQHALKFGGIVKRLRYNSFNVGRLRGEYQFQTLQDLLLTRPNRFEAGHVTQGMRGMRQWLFGFYFQDDFRATSRLTFNLGLRYEFVTIVTEANGRIANLRNPLDPQVTVGDPWFRNPSLRNFAPRFGFAYDPGGNAKTAIRGGFGIYHDQLLSLYWRDSGNRILPWTRRLFITPSPATPVIPFPDAIRLFDLSRELLSDPTMFPELMPYDPSQPNTMQYNLTIQRQFLPTMSLMIGYLGSQSRHNSRNVQWNPSSPTAIINGEKFFAPNTPRRNPNFSSVLQREMDSNANYNSLQVVLKKRFSHNLNFDIVYQWGRIMDEMSGIAGSTDFANITSIAMDPDDRSRDYGRAAFDIRHYLTVNGTYEIPYGSLTGVVRQILGGWRLSSLFNYSSGEPFSVVNRFDRAGNNMLIYGFQERPNVAPGRSNNPIIGDPDRWFDTTAFELQPAGFFGNAGRNTLQGPNLITMDLAVLKTFPLGEARKVEFRWEMFNLMNRANFSQPTFTVFLNPTTRDPNAGRITSTRSSSRQMQFGLKFLF